MGVTTKRPNLKRAARAKRQHSTVNTSQQRFFSSTDILQILLLSGVDLIWKHEIDTMLPNVKPETCQHRNTQRGKGKTENVIWLQSCVCRFLFDLRAVNCSPKQPTFISDKELLVFQWD